MMKLIAPLKSSIALRLFFLFFLSSLLGCSQNDDDDNDSVALPMMPNSVATSWPTYGGQSSGTQYSSLAQINTNNIDQLEVAWTYHAGDLSSGTEQIDKTVYQVTPIYNNDRLYLCTPFSHFVSLDPATGKELWRFDPKKPLKGAFYGRNYCRGVAYWQADSVAERQAFCGKKVIGTTQNGVLIALDADSGQLCSDFGDQGRIDLNKLDYKGNGLVYSTSPPAIYKHVVITGGSSYDNKWGDSLDGIVRGFDVRTGKELWNWNPIPAHLSDKTGGANVWAPISIDQQNGWVFLPTSSPSYDVLGVDRTEPIPHANAVVVLDALTGKLIWSYQTVRHDLWDYDLPSMPTLVNVMRDGELISAVLQGTKMGYIFVLDRLTGEPLFPVVDTPMPPTDIPGEYSSPTQPIPQLPASVTSTHLTSEDGWGLLYFDEKACEKQIAALRNDGLYTPPSLQGSALHPSFLGGTNWGGIAYDEQRGVAVVNSSNLIASVTLIPREQYNPDRHKKKGFSYYEMKGSPYVLVRGALQSPLGFGQMRSPCNPPPWGNLTAIDMHSGETLWQVPFGQIELAGPFKSFKRWGSPNQGGPIITKGGLIFIGASPDSLLRAYDIKTGELIWTGDIPAPAIATPMTYQHGADKTQFVVVAAGGHDDFGTVKSDAIVAFSLKK